MEITVGKLRRITRGKHASTVIDIKDDGSYEVTDHVPQTGGRRRLDWTEIWDLYANHKMTFNQIGLKLNLRRQSVRNVIRRIEKERDNARKKKLLPRPTGR